MCGTIYNKPVVRIAKKSILVYKRLCYYQSGARSEHMHYLWQRYKKQPIIKLKPIKNWSYWEIYEGYHSRKSGKYQHLSDRPNAIFVIPKGTRYIEAKENSSSVDNYVSENLIFIGKMNIITWLIAKIVY